MKPPLTEGENFVEMDESRVRMTEAKVQGFKIACGCFAREFEEFLVADERNHLRLYDAKKAETSFKLKRLSKFARCFSFADSDVVFFTFQNNSILVKTGSD